MENFIRSSIKRKVLIVDDEMINRELLGAILGSEYEVSFAENGKQALEMLRHPEIDYSLVVLDLRMPVLDGFEVIKQCKADRELRQIPIIVATTEKSAEVKSISMGAADFITKPYDMADVILARCRRIIELSEDKTIIKYTEKDSLTGLYTKQYFDQYVHRLVKYVDNDMDAVELRIDGFGLLMDLYGREEGFRLLSAVAGLVSRDLAVSRGIACRTADNSIYVYLEHRDNYEEIVRGFQSEVSEKTDLAGIHLRAGIYEHIDNTLHPDVWFERARATCDRVCGRYENFTARYSRELHELSMYRHRLIGDMQDAIDNHDFMVYYQPKYNIQGDKPVLASAEALIRWKHRELGMLSPGDFIPLFEQNGLIRKIDGFVWCEAAAQVACWKKTYGVSVPVSVNVSRVDIFDPKLPEKLSELTGEFGLEPHEFMLEITESAYSNDADGLIAVLKDLRGRGFKIEMDDFGSGYSSLNMLTTIPFDVLKMDMKFIRNMFRDEKSLKMVELVMDIASFLNIPVVAEGVEEQRQLDVLKQMGCAVVQGYYFSPPVPADRFEQEVIKSANI